MWIRLAILCYLFKLILIMKSREEILQAIKTHLQECEEQFAFATDENEDADIEEIELGARIETLRWTISLFED